jgi:hypothetical protein
MSGMETSRMTMSGRSSIASSIASAPSCAVSAVRPRFADWSTARTMLRMSALSSTTSALCVRADAGGADVDAAAPAGAPQCGHFDWPSAKVF